MPLPLHQDFPIWQVAAEYTTALRFYSASRLDSRLGRHSSCVVVMHMHMHMHLHMHMHIQMHIRRHAPESMHV